MRNSAPRLARGFTLVELAIVLILIAVLAAYIAPRLQTSEFDELGFFVDTLSAIRYAHKVALTSACDVLVTVTPGAGGGVALTYTGVGGCAAGAVFNPADATPFTTTAPANVAIAGPSFTYDLIGDISGAADITLTVTGATSRTISVTDQTGFAFSP